MLKVIALASGLAMSPVGWLSNDGDVFTLYRNSLMDSKMRIHVATGDRAAAVRVFHECVSTLQRELGASAAALQWIVDAYTLVFAGLLVKSSQPATQAASALLCPAFPPSRLGTSLPRLSSAYMIQAALSWRRLLRH